MKIVATPTSATPAGQSQASPVPLGDDAKKPAEYIRSFLPGEARTPQTRGGYQKPFKDFIDRFNRAKDVTWQVDRTFKTNEECHAFASDHPDVVPTNCTLTVTINGRQRIYDGCFIHDVRVVEQGGVSCVFQYKALMGPVRSN